MRDYVITLSRRTPAIDRWPRDVICGDNQGMRWTSITVRVLALLAAIGGALGRAVWPTCCAFCGAKQRERPVCKPCSADLPRIARNCLYDQAPFVVVIAPFDYAFPVDAAIKAFKFRRKLFYAPAFAHLLGPSLAALPDDVDAVLPVPLHWRRHALRGFNQAAEIARLIRAATGLPLVSNVSRRRATPYQSRLAAAQRKRNLRAAFAVRGELVCNHVLIVDDVITTGETCRQLAKVVLQAGVDKVSVLAIARAMTPD